MFTSDTKIRKQVFKAAVIFLAISLFCILFNYIYSGYSHGVSSGNLTLLFLYPLVGGSVMCLLIGLVSRLKMPGRLAVNLYNSGLSTLMVGSLLKGIFDIAGTSSPYQPFFAVVGWLLVSVAVAGYLASHFKVGILNKGSQKLT